MFLLVPAHPGFPGQIPQSRKTVVLCVCYLRAVGLCSHCLSLRGKVVITDWFAVKDCCIWLDTLNLQQQLVGGLPFRQFAVTVQFKMASKMAAVVLSPHCKKTHKICFL